MNKYYIATGTVWGNTWGGGQGGYKCETLKANTLKALIEKSKTEP